MGLFDYQFDPYQGGLLGPLGANNMAGLAQSYGGYQRPPYGSGAEPNAVWGPPLSGAEPSGAWGAMPGTNRARLAAGADRSYAEPSAAWGLPPGSGAEPNGVWGAPLSGAEPDAAWQKPPAFTIDNLIKSIASSPLLSNISPWAPRTDAPGQPASPLTMPSLVSPAAAQPQPAPQTMTMPMPPARPQGLGQPQPPQQNGLHDGLFGGPGLSQSAMGGGYGGGVFPSNAAQAALPPNAQPTQGQAPAAQNAMAQGQPQQQRGFNPMSSIGNFFGSMDPANRPTLQETGTDPFTGQKTFAWVSPQNQTMTPATMGGQPSGTGNAGGMGQFAEAMRAGVGGQELLKLAPPEVKNRLQAMLEGREAPPTQAALRNPQVQALINAAHSIDPTFDETSWGKRNDFIKQLQKGSNNTLGGQRNAGNTALAHLGTVASAATDLGNVDLGGWFPGLAGLVNKGRQSLTAEQAAKANGFNDAVDRYVAEVGRYYSGSSGGGVGEREEARKRLSAAKTNQELAAAIQVERELFHGKLKQMEEQRDEALGPYAKNYAIMMPHGEKAMGEIDKSLSRMRGDKAAENNEGGLKAGTYNWTPHGGASK